MGPNTSLTTTGTASFGTSQVAQLVEWALNGFPKEGNSAASFAIAAVIVLSVHMVQKLISARIAAKAAPDEAKQAQA